jgi:hypothetical protein
VLPQKPVVAVEAPRERFPVIDLLADVLFDEAAKLLRGRLSIPGSPIVFHEAFDLRSSDHDPPFAPREQQEQPAAKKQELQQRRPPDLHRDRVSPLSTSTV